jgi:hypothetical protein
MAAVEIEHKCSNPTCSTLLEVVLCLVELAIEEINTTVQGFGSAKRIYGEERKEAEEEERDMNKFYPIYPLTYSYQIEHYHQ